MVVRVQTMYVASDGQEFTSSTQALDYERNGDDLSKTPRDRLRRYLSFAVNWEGAPSIDEIADAITAAYEIRPRRTVQ